MNMHTNMIQWTCVVYIHSFVRISSFLVGFECRKLNNECIWMRASARAEKKRNQGRHRQSNIEWWRKEKNIDMLNECVKKRKKLFLQSCWAKKNRWLVFIESPSVASFQIRFLLKKCNSENKMRKMLWEKINLSK
jgi:hypothetical protein